MVNHWYLLIYGHERWGAHGLHLHWDLLRLVLGAFLHQTRVMLYWFGALNHQGL